MSYIKRSILILLMVFVAAGSSIYAHGKETHKQSVTEPLLESNEKLKEKSVSELWMVIEKSSKNLAVETLKTGSPKTKQELIRLKLALDALKAKMETRN